MFQFKPQKSVRENEYRDQYRVALWIEAQGIRYGEANAKTVAWIYARLADFEYSREED
jgi:hypothetical protein